MNDITGLEAMVQGKIISPFTRLRRLLPKRQLRRLLRLRPPRLRPLPVAP